MHKIIVALISVGAVTFVICGVLKMFVEAYALLRDGEILFGLVVAGLGLFAIAYFFSFLFPAPI